MPDVVTLIRVKRDNERPLTDAEIGWLFRAYLAGQVADEQMSALLMAIYFNGMSGPELRAWTGEMIASGERLDLSALPGKTVDKHSTGGVGDKVLLSSRRWWPAAVRSCPCCPAGAWGTPAGPWTSWSPSPASR